VGFLRDVHPLLCHWGFEQGTIAAVKLTPSRSPPPEFPLNLWLNVPGDFFSHEWILMFQKLTKGSLYLDAVYILAAASEKYQITGYW
jgi:hypothetical protein